MTGSEFQRNVSITDAAKGIGSAQTVQHPSTSVRLSRMCGPNVNCGVDQVGGGFDETERLRITERDVCGNKWRAVKEVAIDMDTFIVDLREGRRMYKKHSHACLCAGRGSYEMCACLAICPSVERGRGRRNECEEGREHLATL